MSFAPTVSSGYIPIAKHTPGFIVRPNKGQRGLTGHCHFQAQQDVIWVCASERYRQQPCYAVSVYIRT
jgi:hypothetical protein